MSVRISLTEAKAKLSELLAMAEAGEEVIITRAGEPIVQLAPISRITTPKVRVGILDGLIDPSSMPDFLEPMSEEELANWGA